MEYMTIQEAANRWGISERRIQVLCTNGLVRRLLLNLGVSGPFQRIQKNQMSQD